MAMSEWQPETLWSRVWGRSHEKTMKRWGLQMGRADPQVSEVGAVEEMTTMESGTAGGVGYERIAVSLAAEAAAVC